jgi:hypothetical protein
MHSGFAMLVAVGPVVLLVVSILLGGLILLALYAIALYGISSLIDQGQRGTTRVPKEPFWRLDPPSTARPDTVSLIGLDD